MNELRAKQRLLRNGALAGLGLISLSAMGFAACGDGPAMGTGGGGAGGSPTTVSSASSASSGGGSASCAPLSPDDTLTSPVEITSHNGALDAVLQVTPFGGSIPLTNCTINGKNPVASCAFSGGFSYIGSATGSSSKVGGIPGPTLVLKQGETLSVLLQNSLPASPSGTGGMGGMGGMGGTGGMGGMGGAGGAAACADSMHGMDENATNLHTHGLHVSPGTYQEAMDNPSAPTADNIYLSLAPGESHQYSYGNIGSEHPTGMFWYHPHNHMTSNTQVGNGLAGALIVKGKIDDVLAQTLPCLKDRLMVMQAFSAALPAGADAGGNTTYDPAWVINGQSMPKITIRPGEVQRWRVLNAAAEAFLYLAIAEKGLGTCLSATTGFDKTALLQSDCDLDGAAVPWSVMSVIGVDGTPLATPVQKGLPLITLLDDAAAIDPDGGCPNSKASYQPGYLLPPGKRIEFLVQFDKSTPPGTYSLVTRGISAHADPFATSFGRELAEVVVEGDPVTDMAIPTTLVPPQDFGLPADMRKEQVSTTECFGFSVSGSDFLINDKTFCPETPITTVKLEDKDQWNVVSGATDLHPFHVHVNPFQLTAVNGVNVSACLPSIYEDTVTLTPAPVAGTPSCASLGTGSLSLRTQFHKWTGDPVFHCHVLFHEDHGMMARFTIK